MPPAGTLDDDDDVIEMPPTTDDDDVIEIDLLPEQELEGLEPSGTVRDGLLTPKWRLLLSRDCALLWCRD